MQSPTYAIPSTLMFDNLQKFGSFVRGIAKYGLERGLGLGTPKGFLGLKWGDDAIDAATRLGLHCDRWEPWSGGHGIEYCFDGEHELTVFAHQATTRLFRTSDNRLVAIELHIADYGTGTSESSRNEIATAVRKAFGLDGKEPSIYVVFGDNSIVHLDQQTGDAFCTLTVGGPTFGRAFVSFLLGRGLQDFSAGLKPH